MIRKPIDNRPIYYHTKPTTGEVIERREKDGRRWHDTREAAIADYTPLPQTHTPDYYRYKSDTGKIVKQSTHWVNGIYKIDPMMLVFHNSYTLTRVDRKLWHETAKAARADYKTHEQSAKRRFKKISADIKKLMRIHDCSIGYSMNGDRYGITASYQYAEIKDGTYTFYYCFEDDFLVYPDFDQ